MSLEAVAWALKQRVGDSTAKLILIGLADHHNASTELCCPRHALLAVAADCDERTVIRKLKVLEDGGWITLSHRFENGRQTSNSYVLKMAGNLGCRVVTLPPAEGCQVVTLGGDTAVTPSRTVIGTIRKEARIGAGATPSAKSEVADQPGNSEVPAASERAPTVPSEAAVALLACGDASQPGCRHGAAVADPKAEAAAMAKRVLAMRELARSLKTGGQKPSARKVRA